jgi:integrase/recombinase XerD
VERKLLSAPTAREVEIILSYCHDLEERCFIALAFSSGLRLSELCRIQIQDIDLEAKTLRTVCKGNKEALAVFDARTKDFLTELIADRQSGSLFDLTPRQAQLMIEWLSERSGVKFSCHSLRRSFASNLRRKGMDISHIMVLGHWQSLAMPLRYSESVRFEDSAKLYSSIVD